jgi:hypothetical protein
LGIWRRRGEKTNWVRIHHMDTWIHRILQMRNKSRGSLFSTWTNWGRTRKESGFFNYWKPVVLWEVLKYLEQVVLLFLKIFKYP